MAISFLKNVISNRLWALMKKEFRQTLRNRLLLYLLIVPPTVQLLILAASLDPALRRMSLALCDQSNSPLSRQLTDTFRSASVFQPIIECSEPEQLYKELEAGQASAGIVIPRDFEKEFQERNSLNIQTILDGSDAYTANVAKAYLGQTLEHFQAGEPGQAVKGSPLSVSSQILFNPSLKSSWFFATGVLGAVLTVVGTLVSSAVLLREKEHGTLEQLLMAPAFAWEIILAKIFPLILLLVCDLVLAVLLSRLFFGMPFACNAIVFLLGSVFYIASCVGIGMLLGTLCSSQRQAQLASFFISIPLIQLSGSVVPFDSMPAVLQALSCLDPLRYFTLFVRAALLKGAGLDLLLPHMLILFLCATVLLGISTMRFRRQLG